LCRDGRDRQAVAHNYLQILTGRAALRDLPARFNAESAAELRPLEVLLFTGRLRTDLEYVPPIEECHTQVPLGVELAKHRIASRSVRLA
jgi:hypothetical protein